MTLRRQQERLGLQVLSTQRSVVSNVSALGDTHQQPKATATNSQTVSKGKGPRAEQEAASDESASEEEKGEQEFYGKSCEQDNHESSVSSERESSADSLADKPIKVVGVRKIETEPLVSLLRLHYNIMISWTNILSVCINSNWQQMFMYQIHALISSFF